ncbi:hypothetical protein EDC01DRAFT_787369 [Geopyxis carbonaria]|nr:hypothetical protein EDC01DRAFT_787369 [Geopyxis carbonaria]
MTTNTPEILMATTTNDVAPGPNDNHLSDHLPEPPPHPHMWISTIEELEYYCEIGPTVIKRHIPRRGVIAPKARYGIDGRLFPLEEMHERNAKFDELKKVEAMENREKERRGKKRNWFIIKQVTEEVEPRVDAPTETGKKRLWLWLVSALLVAVACGLVSWIVGRVVDWVVDIWVAEWAG